MTTFGTIPPKDIVARLIPTGYYIPAILVGLWWSRYGREAWFVAAQSRN